VPLTREGTQAQIEQARASLQVAMVGVKSAESAVEESRARLEARRSATEAMRADVAGAQSTYRQAGRELERVKSLLKNDLVARRDYDQAEAAYETAGSTVEALQRRMTQSEREIQQAEAELGNRAHAVDQARQRVVEARAMVALAESQIHQVSIKDAEASRAEAKLREVQADLAFADLQLEHTEVRAALDGTVSKRNVELGQVVQMGQPLLAIVPLQDVWVVANFKETQLGRLRPGMKASVEVDGYPDKSYTGTIESMSAGTGARFSLLPPENATGNWVKVVQRVPVRIHLDGKTISNPHTLRAGMSVVVTVRVR
jgi:membrane fusion protein (multidrug efflux system)